MTRPTAALAAVVALVSLLPLVPALQAGFLNWDDNQTVLDNPHFRGLGLEQLRWAFTTFYMGHYQPLSWLSLGLDHALWGLEPYGNHLTNVVMHAANAVLVLLLIDTLLRRARQRASAQPSPPAGAAAAEPGPMVPVAAALAALWFSVHPLRIESVAWVTERRDVLSSFFLLLVLLAYLRSSAEPEPQTGPAGIGRRMLALLPALLLYGLSLLAKASGVTFWLVLLVLDAYPLGRLPVGRPRASGRVLLEKLPFFALALAAALAAPRAQAATAALVPLSALSLGDRLVLMVHGWLYYLWKSVVPLRLSPLYELPVEIRWSDPRFAWSAVGLALLVLVAVGWLRRAPRHAPALLAVAVVYTALLLPVLGLFQSGPQLVADRYSYLPAVALATLLAAGLLARLEASQSTLAARALLISTGLLLVGLGLLSHRYCTHWQSTMALWRQALLVDPACGFCREGLATELVLAGRTEEAIAEYRRALEERPNLFKANSVLAFLLERRGEAEAARSHYLHAYRLDPRNLDLLLRYAQLSAAAGDVPNAVGAYERLLAVLPAHPQARAELALLMARAPGGCPRARQLLLEPGTDRRAAALLERARRDLEELCPHAPAGESEGAAEDG